MVLQELFLTEKWMVPGKKISASRPNQPPTHRSGNHGPIPPLGVVRSFTVDFRADHFNSRCDLLLGSLKLMSTLDHLWLSPSALDDRHSFILLKECNFPQLIGCAILAPFSIFTTQQISDAVALFLAGHSNLKRFHIHSSVLASPSIRVSLPNLEYYEGNSALIPTIHTNSLKEVHLTWCPQHAADVDQIVLRLDSMAKPGFPFVSSHRFLCASGNQTIMKVVTSVSKHMRHTKTLRLQASQRQDILDHMTECLPRFTGLVYLALQWTGSFLQPRVTKDRDEIVVEGWGNSCPTLEACCLNRCGWKKADGRWEKRHNRAFWALAGLSATQY
ncbi:hypothetical protein MSAN_02050400 [Mycena sanguinolenta]|uniref:Uncharacterized protein n=1 Tax=Mycena sanguinolenta TaxID=230812 RepID=A0A8H6XK90_9AGAR|nr:hypothetical protein MSAN_02050400 [Mycena sanguinolenta]